MRRHINHPNIPFFAFPLVGGLAAVLGQHGHTLYALLLAVPAAGLFVWGALGTRVYWR